MNMPPATRRLAGLVMTAVLVCCGLAVVVLTSTADGRGPASVPSPPAPPSAAEAPNLAVDVEKPRYLVAQRMVEVIVVNEGASPVRVEQIQLFGLLFDARPPIGKDTLLQPAQRKDLKVGYGRVRCGRQAPSSPEPFVRLWVRTSDGSQARARLALPSPSPTLQRLHDTECGLLALREAVHVGYAQTWTRTGKTEGDALATLVLRRGASRAPITLTAVGGNVIFTVTPLDGNPDDSPQRGLARLQPADRRLEMLVTVEASRCDAHAVADSKKTFLLPLWLRVGAAEEQYLEVEVTGRGRRLLTDLISDCVAAERG